MRYCHTRGAPRPRSAKIAAISAACNRLGEGEASRATGEPVEAARADIEPLARFRGDRFQRHPQIGRRRLRVRRKMEDRRDCARAGADRRPVERRRGVGDPQRLGEHQPALPPHPPAVGKPRGDLRLTRSEAAKDDPFDDGQRGVGGDIGFEPALQSRSLEQQRLLRRPGQRAAARHAEMGLDPHRFALAAVDLFRRLRGDEGPRIGADRHFDPRPVAPRHAAAGVDHHRLAFGPGVGEAQPQAAGLEHPRRLAARARPLETRPRLAARALAPSSVGDGAKWRGIVHRTGNPGFHSRQGPIGPRASRRAVRAVF